MTALKQAALTHKWALILALLTALVVSAPQTYFRLDHRADGVYQGIELLPDSPWSARVREVMDGHPNFGAIYYKDGKDNPYLFQPLGSMAVAYTGKTLGLDINDTLLAARLIFTALAFIAIYAFVFLWSRNSLVALASASILLLAESVLNPYGLSEIIRGRSPEDFLRIARPVNPAMVYILFFGFLGVFYKFYERLDWRFGALAALILGLNFYNYFYSWTYLFAFGGILGLSILFRKLWAEAFKVAAVFIGALLVAVPYVLNLYAATWHPNYLEVAARNGVVETHEPLFVGLVVLAALAAFLFGYPKEDRRAYWFGLALLLAPFITLNQQLITGKVLQAAHYHWFFHKPIAVIFFVTLGFYFLERFWPKLSKPLAILAILGSLGLGVFVQSYSYSSGWNDGGAVAVERQKYGPVMDWLDENTKKEEAVFGNNEASHMVVIYTPLNVLYHRAGMYSLASSKERLLETMYLFYRLRGVGYEDAKEVFFKERGYLSANIYGMHYRELLGSYEAIPDGEVEEILGGYLKTLQAPKEEWLKGVFTKYETSYAIWDKKKDPTWALNEYPFWDKAASFGDLEVYKFLK